MRGANVYPLEYFGAPLLAEKFPLSANEKSLLEFTGTSDPKVARQYLDITEGDLDAAVATYVDREVPCAPPSAVRDANASLVSVSEDLDSNSDEFASSPKANDDAIMLWEKESDDEERFLGITGTSEIDVAIRFLEMADGNLVTAVKIWRGVPCASLSTDEDDGDKKLPAARPAVLSTAAISSLTQLPRDDDDDGDDKNDNDDDDDGDDNDDKDDDDKDGGLNDINGMSEYELKRMRNVARKNARLESLGLLVPMTSAGSLSSDPSNRKKHSASQDDVERRVQPKRNAKQPTSYRDFNDDNDDVGDDNLDSDTIDLDLQSDEDGDLNDDNNSHDELDINMNDLDLQSNEDSDEVSKKSTIRFSNSDSNGPEVFEAAVNNDDLKPPARHTVLPPPCLRLTMQRRKRRRRRSFRSIIRSIIQKMRRRA